LAHVDVFEDWKEEIVKEERRKRKRKDEK